EMIRQAFEVESILPTPLDKKRDKERVVLSEQSVTVELAVLLRKVIRVRDRGLAEGETEPETAEKIWCQTCFACQEAEAIRCVLGKPYLSEFHRCPSKSTPDGLSWRPRLGQTQAGTRGRHEV